MVVAGRPCREITKYGLTNNLLSYIILGIEVGNKKMPGAYDKVYGKPRHGTYGKGRRYLYERENEEGC